MDFQLQLRKSLSQSMEADLNEAQSVNDDLRTTIDAELKIFKISKQKSSSNLNFAYLSLLSISGISVESERAFSAAGYFCNKFRSSLSDENLNNLCVLRTFFQTNNLKWF